MPRELLTNPAFWSVYKQWWPSKGGLPEEIRVLERLAEDRRIHPADLIFRAMRKVCARGDFD